MSDMRSGRYLYKNPAVNFHPEKGLVIRNDAVKYRRYKVAIPKVARKPKRKWTNIKMSQQLMKGKLMFRVVIDGVEEALTEIKDPNFLQNVEAFAAYTYRRQPPVIDGWMRGLRIKFKEKEQFVKKTGLYSPWHRIPAVLASNSG